MQWRHKKEQWLLAWLEEAAEVCHIKHAAQKVQKEAEAKVREKAKKRRIAEKKKKKTLEYLQQLWDEILVEGAKRSYITGSKHKEVTPEDKRECQPSKKAKEKQPTRYCRDARIKMEGANLYERYVHTRQDCLVYNLR